MMKKISLLIFLFAYVYSSVGLNPSVSYIFPPQHSHFFNKWSTLEVKLTESILHGDQTQQKFGISLWLKLYIVDLDGPIFTVTPPETRKSWEKLFSISIFWENNKLDLKSNIGHDDNVYFQRISVPCTTFPNWIFIGMSAGFENKSWLLYYNDFVSEFYTRGFFLKEISIEANSLLVFGGDNVLMTKRISDFRIHNNIYNEVSEWKSQYSSSCISISCASLFPSVDWGKCDQWCASEVENFIPMFDPVLYSNAPYLTISDKVYWFGLTLYDISPSAWHDYSITGWFQIQSCTDGGSRFFALWNHRINEIDFELRLSKLNSDCDKLIAKLYSTDGTNKVYDSVSITGSSYISVWFFVAITLNSASKQLILYSQNGNNPPSSSFPLISSSVYYTYTSTPFNLQDMDVYIGGYNKVTSPGNYADFRIYPGNFIDSTLMQYNNNIYSAATYLDPHCLLWESIWYCDSCEVGYFLKNGICQKCHFACANCTSDDTETNCLGCANGYYAQPGHPSLCLDYCPLGYTWDSSLNKCTGNPGVIVNINFDDNLSGNFNVSTLNVQLGTMINYYPNFDFADPSPANQRGIYFNQSSFAIINEIHDEKIVSSDFTIEIWAMPLSSSGRIFTSGGYVAEKYVSKDILCDNNYPIYLFYIYLEENTLKFVITIEESNLVEIELPSANKNGREWELYSLSLSYDIFSKISQILALRNKNYYKEIIKSYYREIPNIAYRFGFFEGFLYSFSMYNYGKSYSEIISGLSTSNSCSAYPTALKSCLPTCNKTEYVDEDGNCQKCPKSCSGTCSRANTCNLCYDDLCYKCSKYEIGACTECTANAILINGKCKCHDGYIVQDYECVNECGDGYYLDLNAQKCLSCSTNCLKCIDEYYCKVCKSDYTNKDGKCSCMDGYFIDSSNKCLKCDNSCLTCSNTSSNCISCPESLPILNSSNKCYPCDSFEGYSTYYTIPITYFSDDLFNELSNNCLEICGDGINMGQLQCDDGNNNNGDGCSSSCLVETGWSCFGGGANTPDACNDITSPLPILAYLTENNSGYLLALTFSELVILTSELSKIIELEVKNNLKFDWSITEKTSMFVITLIMHESVSAGTTIKVIFKYPSSIIDLNGNEMKVKSVSTALLESFSYKVIEAIKSSVTTATTVAAASSAAGSLLAGFFWGSFDFQALWGMIEIMQIQNYLIFLSPKYPENLMSYLEALGIANGNFLPNTFQLYLIKSDPFSNPPQKFIEQNYNTDFLMNSGQFIFVWIIILIGLPISFSLYKFWPRLSIVRILKNSYLFSILLRTGIETFLEISLSALLQLKKFSYPNQDIGYLSLTLSILTMFYLILTFALIIWQVTLKSKQTLNMKLHQRQFGTLYEGFKRDSKFNASFLIFQNSRRFLLVVLCVFLYDYPVAQIALSLILSFTYTLLLILLRPYENSYLGNGLHIFCEIFYFISHCLMLKLLDNNISDDYRTNLGWAIIAFLGMSLLLHIASILIVHTKNLIQGTKQFKEWFMKRFSNKFVKVRRKVTLNKIPFSKPSNYIEDTNENMAYFEGKTPENLPPII